MHELGITRNIVAIVAEHARGQQVRRVAIEIGRLSGVLCEAIAFSFDVVSAGTCVEGATLDIRQIDGRGRCCACGLEFPTPQLYTACPCGSRHVERLSGEELKIREFELETQSKTEQVMASRSSARH